VTHEVIRIFGTDYIYFDLVFLTIFTALLAVNKKRIPLLAFILGGLIIFIIDWVFWMQIFKIRTFSLPPGFLSFLPEYWAKTVFMFWFSMSYGLMFAWIFLMFDKQNKRAAWTALLFGGCGIHFMMEFSLWVSGIRPSSLDLLLVNTLVESNMGVPLLYIFWDKTLTRSKRLRV
jgi:hypothetical protein